MDGKEPNSIGIAPRSDLGRRKGKRRAVLGFSPCPRNNSPGQHLGCSHLSPGERCRCGLPVSSHSRKTWEAGRPPSSIYRPEDEEQRRHGACPRPSLPRARTQPQAAALRGQHRGSVLPSRPVPPPLLLAPAPGSRPGLQAPPDLSYE